MAMASMTPRGASGLPPASAGLATGTYDAPWLPKPTYPVEETKRREPFGGVDVETTANVPMSRKDLEKPDLEKIDKIFERCQQFRAGTDMGVKNLIVDKLYSGESYWRWDPDSGDLVEDQILRKYGCRKNVMRQAILTQVAKALGAPVRYEAVPGVSHNLSIERANAATALADHLVKKLDFRSTARRLLLSEWKYNQVFRRVYWDKDELCDLPWFVLDNSQPPVNLGEDIKYLGRVAYQSMWCDVFRGPFGDLKDELIPNDCVFVEPGTTLFEECDRFFVVTRKPMTWFGNQYGERGEAVIPEAVDDQRSAKAEAETDRQANQQGATDSASHSQTAGMAWHKAYYEKQDGRWRCVCYATSTSDPSTSDPSRPRGKFVWLNEDDPDNGLMDDHGIEEYAYDKTEGAFYTPSLAWDMCELQWQHDRARTTLNIGQELASKPVFVTDDEAEPKFTSHLACHVMKVEPRMGGIQGRYGWENIPVQLEPSMKIIEMTQRDIEEVGFVQGVSRGRLPSNPSGKLVKELTEEQQITPDDMSNRMHATTARFVSRMLSAARQWYTEPRVANLFSSNAEMQIVFDEALPAVTEMDFTPTTFMPSTRQDRLRFGLTLRESGFFDPSPEGKAQTLAMLRMMGESPGDMDALYPEVMAVKAAVKRDIALVDQGGALVAPGAEVETGELGAVVVDAQGEPLAKEWQPHEAWMEQINQFRLSEGYNTRWRDRPQARVTLDALYEDHRRFLELAAQQAMAQASLAQPVPAETAAAGDEDLASME